MDEIQKEAKSKGQSLDFSGLAKQLDALKQNGAKYDSLLAAALQKGGGDEARISAVNAALIKTERVLTRTEGLPNRDWYKHQIYAPGFYTGYGVKTVPGVREAVDSGDWALAKKETTIVENCLSQMNQEVNVAINALSGI